MSKSTQPYNQNFSPHRNELIKRSAFLLALPTIASTLTMVVYHFIYGEIIFTGPARTQFWWIAIVPFVVVNITALWLLRIGRANVSALVLITFWTISITSIILRFGAQTFFPALLILPISAASLLFQRRSSLLLAVISAIVVGISAWLHMNRPGFALYDYFRNTVVIDMSQLRLMTSIAVGFWTSLFVAVAAITSLLASNLQRSLQQSDAHATALQELSEQLEQRVIDQTASLLAGEREKAMLAERTRLARDIHDTLAQGLTGIIVQLSAAQQALRTNHPDADEHLDLAARMARESLAEARRSVWNLRAEALERGDLRHALNGLVDRFRHPTIMASYEFEGEWSPLPVEIESALLRVAQESLANVVRHSAADQVSVTLRMQDMTVELEIRDNGRGFGEALQRQTSAHAKFGVVGMRERLVALSGDLQLVDDDGAVVRARAPIPLPVNPPSVAAVTPKECRL
jgi:signal transduction histidine kinase